MPKKKPRSGPLIGAHVSIAGGVHHALERGQATDCRTIQIFTKNANQWRAKPLTDEAIQEFKRLNKESGIGPVVAHDSYLINIASPDPKKRGASKAALLDEMERVEALEIPYLVMHPGAHMGEGEAAGIALIVKSLNEVHKKTRGFSMKILLETTAGQGTNLGYRFEQIGAIMGDVSESDRLGVCVDTCHIFAAGYDIRTREGYEETMDQLFGEFGADNVRCVHINDSLKPFESRVDRHAHIGEGEIGIEG
ncbi:MAG: deoxyribonuclease IV, partial [bacterium]|nr:deoxyribonuclease IV [bacterium]